MPTPAFDDHLNALAAQVAAQGAAAAMPGVAARAWQIPAHYPPATDVRDPAGFITACSRADLNNNCRIAYDQSTNPNDSTGRQGVVGAYKTAIDYQAIYERALHARHATSVRCRVWSAARRAGHSDLRFGVIGCVNGAILDALGAAPAVPNTQPPE